MGRGGDEDENHRKRERERERERERDEIAQSVQSKCSIMNSHIIVLLHAAMPFLISPDASMKKCEIRPEGSLIPVDNIMTVFSNFYPRILWFEVRIDNLA